MTRLVSIAFVLSISATVHAEPPRADEPAPLRYDFDDQIVDGDYPAPKETLIVNRARSRRASLITLRDTFVPELAKSIEDL
jgi:hypothetical protein